MQGIFQWVKDKTSAAYHATYAGVSAIIPQSIKNKASAAYATAVALFPENFRGGFSDWLTQSMEGFWRALSLSNYSTMIKTDKSSGLWLGGMASTFMRIVPVMLYRTLARPLATEMVRKSVGVIPGAETVAMTALDVAATLVIIKATTRAIANSAQNNLSMAKASANETRPVEQADNPLTKACEHGKKANLSAAATSTLHYYGTLFALRGFANTVPYADWLTWPLEALLIGRTYLEYPLRAANNCEQHSLEILNKNNPYAFGIGASYKASDYLIRHYLLGSFEAAITYYTGLKTAGPTNFFIEEVLSSLLSLHFIMTANLQRNAKLPGTAPGVDIFKSFRVATDAFTESAVTQVKDALAGPKVPNWYQEGKQQFQKVINHKTVAWICKLLLDDDLQDWDKFKDRPESKLFFELYGNMLLNGIRYIQKQRERKDYKRLDKANKWATDDTKDESFLKIKSLGQYLVKKGIDAVASDSDQEMLDFLMQPELEAPLQDWYDYILSAIPPQVKIHLDDMDVQIVEDYHEKDAVKLLNNSETVKTETVYDPVPASARGAAPVVVTGAAPQTANFRLFPNVADKPKPAVSMKTSTQSTLDEFSRIISAGKSQ